MSALLPFETSPAGIARLTRGKPASVPLELRASLARADGMADKGSTGGFKSDPNQGRATRATGAFVYRGAGKKLPADADTALRDCKKLSIDLQWCMARRNYNEKYCVDFIRALEDCRRAAYAREDDAASTAGTAPTKKPP